VGSSGAALAWASPRDGLALTAGPAAGEVGLWSLKLAASGSEGGVAPPPASPMPGGVTAPGLTPGSFAPRAAQ